MHTADHQLLLLPPLRPLGERFGAEFFRGVPETPGVYLMCGPGDGVLYVGKARNLRKRLASYRSASTDRLPRKLRRLLASVERIHWDECRDEAAALARERELLLALRPRFNTVGVFAPPLHYFGWQWHGDALFVGMGEDGGGWPDCRGPFAGLRPVHAALLRLAWRVFSPGPARAELPLSLGRSRVPATWRFMASPPNRQLLSQFHERLEAFWSGASPELPEWLAVSALGESRFEAQWQEADAIRLLEFYDRHLAPVAKHS